MVTPPIMFEQRSVSHRFLPKKNKKATDKTVLSRRIETALSMACYSHIAATDLDVGLMLSDFSRCLSVVLAFQDNSDG